MTVPIGGISRTMLHIVPISISHTCSTHILTKVAIDVFNIKILKTNNPINTIKNYFTIPVSDALLI